jgi:hypothetical protein
MMGINRGYTIFWIGNSPHRKQAGFFIKRDVGINTRIQRKNEERKPGLDHMKPTNNGRFQKYTTSNIGAESAVGPSNVCGHSLGVSVAEKSNAG